MGPTIGSKPCDDVVQTETEMVDFAVALSRVLQSLVTEIDY